MASPSPAAAGSSADGVAAGVSEETKRKVAAAKSYIENMYKVQHQNIQERYARYAQSTDLQPFRRYLHPSGIV
jgi:hypothetical protein